VSLHPAQNRGFRELVAATRHVIEHFEALAPRFAGQPDIGAALEDGAATARTMLGEVREAIAKYDLHGGRAAQGVGASLAPARGGSDRFLERNQALRMAVLDVAHAATLLAYLESVSGRQGSDDLAELSHRWHAKMRTLEKRMHAAVIAIGTEPDVAIEPLDPSAVGRAAHSVNYWFGTFGEWFDRKSAERQRPPDAE
jgi:hypothetical protein